MPATGNPIESYSAARDMRHETRDTGRTTDVLPTPDTHLPNNRYTPDAQRPGRTKPKTETTSPSLGSYGLF